VQKRGMGEVHHIAGKAPIRAQDWDTRFDFQLPSQLLQQLRLGDQDDAGGVSVFVAPSGVCRARCRDGFIHYARHRLLQEVASFLRTLKVEAPMTIAATLTPPVGETVNYVILLGHQVMIRPAHGREPPTAA
jgi:hypothetical protein